MTAIAVRSEVEYGQSVAEEWADLEPHEQHGLMSGLTERQYQELMYDWKFWGRKEQQLPPGLWFILAHISGRGAGKTRTGAETVRIWAGDKNDPPIRIAIVAESAADARDIMIEGESGILGVSPPWNMPIYEPSKRRITWPNGSVGIVFSGDKPAQLRGPQFHKAWVDEIAKFQYPEDSWDNLEFGLRLGDNPQVIVTTTPRPIKLIKNFVRDPQAIIVTTSTYANYANLAKTFIQRVVKKYEGTRVGRQELHAEILQEVAGSLWTMEMIENNRLKLSEAPTLDSYERIVIGVDPAMSHEDDSNETGLVVCAARGKEGEKTGYVIEDASGQYTTGGWVKQVKHLFHKYHASRIVAENNQGGELVKTVMHNADDTLPVRLVFAIEGKGGRAEPISLLMEQNKIKHIGQFVEMEDQMVITTPEGYLGTGSPDRMDAMVHAMRDLMLGFQTSTDPDDYETFRK